MVVPVQASLSLTSRWLTRVIAVAYLLLGLIMFVVPGWSAHHFPWKVSPFVAMTIGSYLLGSAWMAGVIQHTWTFARVYPAPGTLDREMPAIGAVGALRFRRLHVPPSARARTGARSPWPNRRRTGRAGCMRRIAGAGPGRSCAHG